MKLQATPKLMFGGKCVSIGLQREGYTHELFTVVVRKVDNDLYVCVTETANPNIVVENTYSDYFTEGDAT
jgi:hypothetical protein